jgi:Homeodomain-like domain
VRRREEVRLVLRLADEGLSRNAIARRTGIPLTTVGRWVNGRPPRVDDPGARTCPRCGHAVHDAIDGAIYSYVLGLYLGDGHLASFPRTECLRIYLDARYPGIVDACAAAIGRLVPRNRVGVHPRRGCVVVQCYSRQWKCLLPQHGPGPKHERRIILADWQRKLTRQHPRELIRGLIHSDGSRFTNPVRSKGRSYEYPRYFFSNRSEDIKTIFCEHLDLLGIAWRRVGHYNISIARREAVAALDAFVGPKR